MEQRKNWNSRMQCIRYWSQTKSKLTFHVIQLAVIVLGFPIAQSMGRNKHAGTEVPWRRGRGTTKGGIPTTEKQQHQQDHDQQVNKERKRIERSTAHNPCQLTMLGFARPSPPATRAIAVSQGPAPQRYCRNYYILWAWRAVGSTLQTAAGPRMWA